MGNWRVAKALDALLAQFNAKYPARSKASDGSIGDAAHASRSSDHNPWFGPGIVTARDFTHDPAHGMDMNRLSAELVATRDRRIKYVIWNRRIIDSRAGSNPWKWMPYNGTNPHDHHMHVSVMDNVSCDDPTPWKLASFGAPPAPTPQEEPLSAQFEADARKRWPAEDQLDKDTRGDLHNKQVQLDRIEATVTALTATVDKLITALTKAQAGEQP